MTLIVGRGHARYTELTVNRTPQSGGSLGGNKKPGTVYYGPTWARVQVPNSRAAKTTPPYTFMMRTTTRFPVQQSGSQLVLSRGTLLG
jgi:hypothetical protein